MNSKEDLEVLPKKEDLEAKNRPHDLDLPLKKRKILIDEPKSKPNNTKEEMRKTMSSMGNDNCNHCKDLTEDLEAKNGPQDSDLPPKKRKIFRKLESMPNQANLEARKLIAVTSNKYYSHRNYSMENLEARNRPQDPDLPSKKRKIFQEPKSKPSQVKNLEARNRPQDPDLPLKTRKIFQERKKKPSQVEEESRMNTIITSNGESGHYNHPYKQLYAKVQPCKELMQTLLGLGIDWHHHLVPVLRKALSETDVNHEQNRLQHSEKEVREVLFGMMTEEEKQLVMQEGAGDGLRVTVLDQQARVYHMNFKMIHSIKYFRFRGPGYHKFVVDNNLKCGEILETYAVRVQQRRGGQISEEGAQGIMDGVLLLLMINYKDDSDEINSNKEIQMLPSDEKDALNMLLLLHKGPVNFGHSSLH